MKLMIVRIALATVVAVGVSGPLQGHGGGLDRNGCHTNRKTGDYHCHGARSAPEAPAAPAPGPRPASLSVRGAATTPAADLVRAAQILLQRLGYKPSLLGTADARTEAAVRAFQRTENLNADGVINEYLVLRLAEAVASRCSP